MGILSAFPGGGSAVGTGTSMACGVISGAAALVAGADLSLRPTIAAKKVLLGSKGIVPQAATVYGHVAPVAALKLVDPHDPPSRRDPMPFPLEISPEP